MPDPVLTPDVLARVRDILRSTNPVEPGGDWSTFDVACILDPDAHTPRSMFDTPPPYPSDAWCAVAVEAVRRLCPRGGRFVGGTTRYLYHLPQDGPTDHEHCADVGMCWQDREPCPADGRTIPSAPAPGGSSR